jgi:hypothetical protein
MHPEDVDRIFLLCPAFGIPTRAHSLYTAAEMEEWERTGIKGAMHLVQLVIWFAHVVHCGWAARRLRDDDAVLCCRVHMCVLWSAHNCIDVSHLNCTCFSTILSQAFDRCLACTSQT